MTKKILLICKRKESGFLKYENLRFREAAIKFNYDLEIRPFNELDLKSIQKGNYDVILPRTGSGAGTHEMILSFLEKLEKNKIKVVNSSQSSRKGLDKYESIKIVERIKNSLVPKTILLQSDDDYKNIKWSSFPAIVKIRYGARGNGVFLLDSLDALKNISKMYSEILLQEYIKESRGRDIRIFVCGNRVLGAICRQSTNDDFRANVALGAIVSTFRVNKDLNYLALSITRSLGLIYCGLDFLIGEKGYYFCEANIHPDFQGFERATGEDVASEILSIL